VGRDRTAQVMGTFLKRRIRVQGFIIFDDYETHFAIFKSRCRNGSPQGRSSIARMLWKGLNALPMLHRTASRKEFETGGPGWRNNQVSDGITRNMEVLNAHDYDKDAAKSTIRIGARGSRGLQSWLAVKCRCLGRSDGLSGLSCYRAIAHDRRGHGRSSQPSNGNNMTLTPTTLQR